MVARVIGVRKSIYDLGADAVNLASRLESHNVPGTVHVTAETARRLGGRYLLEPRGRLAVKGKGAAETFFLVGRQPGRTPSPSLGLSAERWQ